jgi:hypothetical protein
VLPPISCSTCSFLRVRSTLSSGVVLLWYLTACSPRYLPVRELSIAPISSSTICQLIRCERSALFPLRCRLCEPEAASHFKQAYGHLEPRLCSRHLLRLENPCCNARFTILLLNIFMNMPSAQNRSNFAFRLGFLRLATAPTAQSGLKMTKTVHEMACRAFTR